MKPVQMVLQRKISNEKSFYLHIELDENDEVELIMLSTKEPEQKVDGYFGFIFDASVMCVVAIMIDGTMFNIKNGDQLKELSKVGESEH